jgi:hypothetical protein
MSTAEAQHGGGAQSKKRVKFDFSTATLFALSPSLTLSYLLSDTQRHRHTDTASVYVAEVYADEYEVEDVYDAVAVQVINRR